MKQTFILISSLLIACLIGQTYQATCTITATHDEAGQDTSLEISLTGASGTDGYLRLTFGNGWTKDNFPPTGLICSATAGFLETGQQSCEIVPSANNIQVNVYGVQPSQSAITVQLYHMRNPYGFTSPVTCDLMTIPVVTPPTPSTVQATADATLAVDAGSSYIAGDITNLTINFTSAQKFQPGHKIQVVFPDWFKAIPSPETPLSTSFLAGCGLNSACTLESFIASGKIIFKSQNLIDTNVAVSRFIDSQNDNAETLVLTPSVANFTQIGQPMEISFPKAIKTPLNTFYPFDLVISHTDAQGKIISNSQESFNPVFLMATQPGQLNSTDAYGPAKNPGVEDTYTFQLTTNLPLCKGCIIALQHQGLTLNSVLPITKSSDFTPGLTVLSQNSSVILLKSDKFLPKLETGTFTVGGITNPQYAANPIKVAILDKGMNPISALQQPVYFNTTQANAYTSSCKILLVEQYNAIGSTGKMRIEYKPRQTTTSTGNISIQLQNTTWPISLTMPKVNSTLAPLPPNFPGVDPKFPGFTPNTTVFTKISTTTYQIDITQIQGIYSYTFDLQNMISPLTALTSTIGTIGYCYIYEKSGNMQDSTPLTLNTGNSLWSDPMLNANFTPSIQLKNGQMFDANFTLSIPKGLPTSGKFVITLPTKNNLYSTAPVTSYLVGCTTSSCTTTTVWLQSLSSTTAAPYQLTVISTTTQITATLPTPLTAANSAAGNYKMIIKQLYAPISLTSRDEVQIKLLNSDGTTTNCSTAAAKDKPILQSQTPNTFATSPAPVVDFASSASKVPGAATSYLFAVSTTNYIPVNGILVVTLPQTLDTTGTVVVTKTTAADTWTTDVTGANTPAPGQKVIQITFTELTAPGTLISFTLSGINNPLTKVNNYTITTFDGPASGQPNMIDQGTFQINPVVDSSQNICSLNSVDKQNIGIKVGDNIYNPVNLAQWTLTYIPRDIATQQAIIQIALPIAKFQDLSNISCPSMNGEFLPGSNSSCTITKNTTYTTIKIVGAIPFFKYQFYVKNMTNPSVLVTPITTPTISDNIGYCQLFEASNNKLLDTTFFTMPAQQFLKISDPNVSKLSLASKTNGALTTLSLNIQGSVGIYSTDKLYLEIPSRLADFGTTTEPTSAQTFVTASSAISLVQYKLNAPSSPILPATQTQVASYVCTVAAVPDAQTGNVKYTITITFPAGTTYIAPSQTSLLQLNVTNVRLAPQSKSQTMIFKLIDASGNTKIENTNIQLLSEPAKMSFQYSKGYIGVGTPTTSYTFSFTLINPIPVNGKIKIEFPPSVTGPTLSSTSTLGTAPPTLTGDQFDTAGKFVILKSSIYVSGQISMSISLNAITIGTDSYGNSFKITTLSFDGSTIIDTGVITINPSQAPTVPSYCALQTNEGSQIVGQNSTLGFTYYNAEGLSFTGGKLILYLSKKVFGIAPTSISCLTYDGFSSQNSACTLTTDTSNRLVLTINSLNANTRQFSFFVTGIFNPTATQLPTFFTDDFFGNCTLQNATAGQIIGTPTPITVIPTWQPAPGTTVVNSTNSSNGAIGDLSVTYTTIAPITTGTVFQVAIKQVHDSYTTLPYLSSINGLDATNSPSLTFKTVFSCSVGATKYTPTSAVLSYQYNAPTTPPTAGAPTDGDYIKITLNLAAPIPSGSICTFVLANAIRTPLSINQDPTTPQIGTPLTITLFDIKNQPYTSQGSTLIANSQPASLNAQGQMLGSNLPEATPVKYQFQIQMTTSIPVNGFLTIQVSQEAVYTEAVAPVYDSTQFGTFTYDAPTKTFKFPVTTADIFADPSASPLLFTFTFDNFKNPKSLNGNVVTISTIDEDSNLIAQSILNMNPLIPQPSCVVQYSPKDDGSVQTYYAGDQPSYNIKMTLDKALNSTHTGASIIVNFNKTVFAFPDTTFTQQLACTAVSPTYTSTGIVCTVTTNQTSGEGQIKVTNLLIGQNAFEFNLKGLINPQSAQALTNIGQCSAFYTDTNSQQQLIRQAPLTNNGIQLQAAKLTAKQIATTIKNVGIITDPTITFTSPVIIQNGTIITLNVYRKTVDYIGKGISASNDSSIINCTIANCTPKVTMTSLICTKASDTIVVPYQNIKVSTAYVATQKYDNITLIPIINTPIPSGYSCSTNFNGLLYNLAHEGSAKIDIIMIDAKGNPMIKDTLQYDCDTPATGLISATVATVVALTTPPTITQTYTFQFKTINPIPIGGRINLVYTANTPNTNPELNSATPAGVQFDTTSGVIQGDGNVIALVNSGAYINAGQNITFSIAGFTTSTVYTGNKFTVNTFIINNVQDIDTALIELNPVAPITFSSQAFDSTNIAWTLTFKCPIDLAAKDYNISLTYTASVQFAPTTAAPCTFQGGIGGAGSNMNCLWTAATKNIIIPNDKINTATKTASTDITLQLNNFKPAATTALAGTAKANIQVIKDGKAYCSGDFVPIQTWSSS